MARGRARLVLTPIALLCAAMGACSSASGTQQAVPVTTSALVTTTTVVPTTTSAAPTTLTTTTTAPLTEKHAPGDSGPEIAAIQQRLTDLGYRPGDVDGSYSAPTASAVLAFQKREGIGRDGVAGPETLAQLDAPQGAGPRDTSAAHLEVDLDRQILFAVEDGGAYQTINVSSGSGKRYSIPNGGGQGVAITPTGEFTILRRIDGFHKAPLGVLYRPLFFHGGYAIHGSSSVPAYPASHGCVRASNADQDFLWPTFANDTPVVVYSGAPDAPTAADVDPNAQPD